MPLHLHKIDQSFHQHYHDDEKTGRVVATIIAVAQGLGLKVITEGIEQREQKHRLRELGCQLGQCFIFSMPLAAQWLERLLSFQREPYLRSASPRYITVFPLSIYLLWKVATPGILQLILSLPGPVFSGIASARR